MRQDNELLGVGLAFLTVAVFMYLVLSGSIDPNILRTDLVRLWSGGRAAFDAASAL